jgi:YQGE family putative transporter
MAKPLHDVSYFPTEFKIIDIVSEKSKRSKYSYIVNHEFTLLFGRIGVILIFLFMAYRVSPEFALRYGLVVIAIIMILSILLAKSLMGNSKKE